MDEIATASMFFKWMLHLGFVAPGYAQHPGCEMGCSGSWKSVVDCKLPNHDAHELRMSPLVRNRFSGHTSSPPEMLFFQYGRMRPMPRGSGNAPAGICSPGPNLL